MSTPQVSLLVDKEVNLTNTRAHNSLQRLGGPTANSLGAHSVELGKLNERYARTSFSSCLIAGGVKLKLVIVRVLPIGIQERIQTAIDGHFCEDCTPRTN